MTSSVTKFCHFVFKGLFRIPQNFQSTFLVLQIANYWTKNLAINDWIKMVKIDRPRWPTCRLYPTGTVWGDFFFVYFFSKQFLTLPSFLPSFYLFLILIQFSGQNCSNNIYRNLDIFDSQTSVLSFYGKHHLIADLQFLWFGFFVLLYWN